VEERRRRRCGDRMCALRGRSGISAPRAAAMPVAGVRLGTPLALDGLSQSPSAPLLGGASCWGER
jgi:hypothetical protein